MASTQSTPPGAGTQTAPVEVSVVIPCLNEAENIEDTVTRCIEVLTASGLHGEVVVADNGSEDGSADLARAAGARVVEEPRRGFGSA
jgi:glycosyltransferase involved in cell wall biosynthesis